MFLVFLSHLGRPAESEAVPLGEVLGLDPYDVRLALKAPAPTFLTTVATRELAADMVGRLRARGHGAESLDEDLVVPASRMTTMNDFRLDADGVHVARGFLPYGDALALLLAWHDLAGVDPAGAGRDTPSPPPATDGTPRVAARPRARTDNRPRSLRERVLYIFRRSGETPWIVRELHTNFSGLGPDRATTARENFERLSLRLREAAPLASYDERLLQRKVAERAMLGAVLRTAAAGIDLMAHMLTLTLAAQTQSPYR